MNKINDNNSGNKRIAKNTFLLYIRLVIVLVISLYTSRVVLNTLGVVDYGIYNVVAGFVSMFALLSTSLTNSVQRFYNYEIGKNGVKGMQSVYITSLYIQVIIALVILLIAETVGLWYIKNKLVYPIDRFGAVIVVYQAAIISLLFIVLQIPYSAAIIARERINYYALVSVVDVFLKLLIAMLTPLFSSDNLMVYGCLIAGISLINFLFYYIYSKHSFQELLFKRVFYKEKFYRMLKFSGWSAVNGFSTTVMDQGINILMNSFFGPVVNAARGIAYQIKGALLGFVMNITTAAKPQLTEAHASGNIARSKNLMFTVSKFLFISFYIVALPIIYEINYVLNLWLGDNVPEYTAIFVVLVLITTFIDILVTPINMLVSAVGDIALLNSTCGVLGILLIPISYIALVHGAQPEHVFYLGLLISIITFVSAIIILSIKTTVGIKEYFRNVVLPLGGTVLLTAWIPFIITNVWDVGFLRFVIVFSVSVLTVIVIGFYISLNKQEKTFLLTIIKRYLPKKKQLL